jgi:hypothetical protein
MKRTPYSAHRCNELRKNKSEQACRQRAQLVGITVRGQKLAEKFILYVGQKNYSQI